MLPCVQRCEPVRVPSLRLRPLLGHLLVAVAVTPRRKAKDRGGMALEIASPPPYSFDRGNDLNEKPWLPDTWDWCEETREWYKTWRDSEVTDDWDERQWQYMFDTAIVHSLVYGSQAYNYLGELSNRLRFMGLTFESDF